VYILFVLLIQNVWSPPGSHLLVLLSVGGPAVTPRHRSASQDAIEKQLRYVDGYTTPVNNGSFAYHRAARPCSWPIRPGLPVARLRAPAGSPV
jgi:hypothetical protein